LTYLAKGFKNKFMKNNGKYFKALRQAKGMTLREVESKTGISNAYLSQIESEKVKQPSPVHLYKLAELYGVSYEILMERVGYPVPKKISKIKKETVYNRFGQVTDEEEMELLEYLKFIRRKK